MNTRAVAKSISMFCRALRVWALESARSIAADAGTIGADLVRELRRLNRLGVESHESANANRRARARIVRERLQMGYRDHTPCC